MSITLDLPPETEARLIRRAAAQGKDVGSLLREIAEREAEMPLSESPRYTAAELLRLPPEERHRIMEQQAAAIAHLYEADLALPPADRELTAFTALDGVDPIYDYYDVEHTDKS